MHRIRQQSFYDKCFNLGINVEKQFYWYHSIDLGNNLVTPGVFDFRVNMEEYHFPKNMNGISILDVGAATGFFSFEFAKRKAIVTATELPTLLELDVFPGQSIKTVLNKVTKYSKDYGYQEPEKLNHELLYKLLLIEPFEFCKQHLSLSVNRRFVNIYNFSEETLGQSTFDWVFIGDVLLHTINPLQALASAAKMCKDTLVIAQHISESPDDRPLMHYVGGDDIENDDSAWWRPNLSWFKQTLKKLGFKSIEMVGGFNDKYLPIGNYEYKTVIHAKRN